MRITKPYKIQVRYNYTKNQSRLIRLSKEMKGAKTKWGAMWIGLKIWWVLNLMRYEMDKKNRKGNP